MLKKEFPQIHYYDQDFVDIYERTWAWMNDFWRKPEPSIGIKNPFFANPEDKEINLLESCFASFFLVYFNKNYPANLLMDNFYEKQEASGAIRGRYSLSDGQPILTEENPEGLAPPFLAWVEYNLYHKTGLRSRVRNVMPILRAYHDWLESNFKTDNGLYSSPPEAAILPNSPCKDVQYPLEFNAFIAVNALYMSALADIMNDKELGFQYKRQYYSLKTRINSLMWDPDDNMYYDLDANENRIKIKTIASFWPLLGEIPNGEKAEKLIEHLRNPAMFGTENPFPTLAVEEEGFDENGGGAYGSVVPALTYLVIKGLRKYKQHELARETAVRHLYCILNTYHGNEHDKEESTPGKGLLWKAYKPFRDEPAACPDNETWNKPMSIAWAGMATIAMMIETIIGLSVSLPRKTVDWYVPTLEIMGIESLPLRRNRITIISNKSNRGWEIRLESEKLYYFSVHLLGENKEKTLPIPSGKCVMLIDKL